MLAWLLRSATLVSATILAAATLAVSEVAFEASAQAQSVDAPAKSVAPASASGLPLPRFVSLKADRVNLRAGPGTDYPTAWVFRRAGLPVEVVSEFETWRQIRDSEGATGWVAQSLLSGRRTALVAPWDVKKSTTAGAEKNNEVKNVTDGIALMSSDSESSRAVALVEPGVIANVHRCDGLWCHVSVGSYSGYLLQKKLWGVYEGEAIK